MKPANFIEELSRALGARAVVARGDDLATYDADASMIVARAPAAVVLPATPEEAARAVAIAVAAGVPVVARGAGTGIAGGAVPVRGGLVLSTARLDKVEAIEPRSRRAVVQPGVVNAELNARVAPLGLQFAPDPSSQRASTIGGNLATNAGGPHCLKYGVTTNHILAVELVRPDGSRVWTADGDGDPSWAGYDLTGLVVGSEGTFGLVTRAMVRLTPLPEANRVVLALFPSVIAASSAVSRVIAAGSLPTSLEVMDHNAIRAVNGAYGLGLPEDDGTTLLIVEVDGVEDGLDATMEEILRICAAEGAFELRPARTPAEQARVWTARKSVAGAIGRLAPAYLLVDTVVPRTRLPMMMEHIERLRREHQMEICNVFHAGDGNLHPLVLYDPRDTGQAERAHAIADAVLALSIQQGGVISGEHGIGLEKQAYLPLLFSPEELQLHATVHTVFNPGDHFNPAKIFPVGTTPGELAALRGGRQGEWETGRVGDRESGRQGEWETGRQGDRESGRQGEWETGRVGDRETGRQGDREAGRQGDRESGRQGEWETGRQGDREAGRQGEVVAELVALVGPEHVAGGADGLIISPGTVEELSRVIALCHKTSITVWPCGRGIDATGLPVSPSPGLLVSLRRLNSVHTYEPDDLTVGVGAGMTLGELRALLAANGQQLPLEVGDDETTIGALVATAADGPRRLGYGTLRDWTLALTVVEPDGTVVRLGAQVVKNVTGYDLVKLYVGSRGTLGVIAAVSLKVFPLPRAAATVVAGFPDRAAALVMLDRLAASRLQPTACEYVEGVQLAVPGFIPHPSSLILRCEGHPDAVARHTRELRAMAEGCGSIAVEELAGEADGHLWRAVAALGAPAAPEGSARVRLCVAPARLGATLEDAHARAASQGLRLTIGARGLNGVIYILVEGPVAGLLAFFAELAARWPHTQLLAAAPAVADGMPAWGATPPAIDLMRALKGAIDPLNQMSPGSSIV